MARRFEALAIGALLSGALVAGLHTSILRASDASQTPLPASSASAPVRAPATGAAAEYVVSLPGSKEYHRPGCDLVRAAKTPAVLLKSQAEARGLKPHADCDPANLQPDGTPKPKPVFVYIQKDDNKYHKAECALVRKGATRAPLDKDAVRGRWPCTVCRPPVRAIPKPAR